MAPEYTDVLQRVKAGHKILDLACCFGQDIRRLVFDGAPAKHICGSELEQGFIDMGYELFKDRDTLTSKITSGDFFAPETADLEASSFDIIHAASFFHLFSWDEQIEAVTRAVALLKPVTGSTIFGRQIGVREASELKHPAARSGSMWRHDESSFAKMVGEVAEKTGIKLMCEVRAVENAQWRVEEDWKLLRFCITLV